MKEINLREYYPFYNIHDDRRLQSKGKLSPKTASAIRVQSAGQNP